MGVDVEVLAAGQEGGEEVEAKDVEVTDPED